MVFGNTSHSAVIYIKCPLCESLSVAPSSSSWVCFSAPPPPSLFPTTTGAATVAPLVATSQTLTKTNLEHKQKLHQSAAEANFWEEYPLWKSTTTHRQPLATTEAMCGTRRNSHQVVTDRSSKCTTWVWKNSPSYYQPKGSIELLSKIFFCK